MIFGKHTLSEVKNLLKTADYEVQQTDKAYSATSTANDGNDPTLRADWAAFMARWNAMKSSVSASVGAISGAALAGASDNVIPDESDYQAILKARSPTYPNFTPQDFAGLVQRINTLGVGIDFSNTPQMTAYDLDLQAYEAASAGTAALNKLGADVKDTAESWADQNKWLIAGGIASTLATVVVLRKMHLL